MAASTTFVVDDLIDRVDWVAAKAALAADNFDNGRSPEALRLSFVNSQHVAFAWIQDELVGMARLLSDGVGNAFLVDVWSLSTHRRKGIGSALVRHLVEQVPGQHVGLQTDDAQLFYANLGFQIDNDYMWHVSGTYLSNEANR